VSTLERDFCDRYGCNPSDFYVHTHGAVGSPRTYLIMRSASLVLQVLLKESGLNEQGVAVLPMIGRTYREGAMLEVSMTRRERCGEARDACLSHYGFVCQACDGNLKASYVGLSKELIHVHHESPLGDSVGERDVDPIRDLKPVCPNCHVVIHSQTPHFEVNEVRVMRGLPPKSFPTRSH
jgi:predicted HNH restriction endonuclease